MKNYFCILLSLLCFISCNKNDEKEGSGSDNGKKHIEILYFDDNSNSEVSKAITDGITAVLDDNFKSEVSDDIIKFRQISLASPDGLAVAEKYNVKGSALFVNNWIGEKEMKKNMTFFAQKNAESNPEIFRKELKTLLSGYLSAEVDSTKLKTSDPDPSKNLVGGPAPTPAPSDSLPK